MFGLLGLVSCLDFTEGLPCESAAQCPTDFACDRSGFCEPAGVALASCPDDATTDLGSVIMDSYEASRSDATSTDEGLESSVACSVAGVRPWVLTGGLDEAEQACVAAGKRLCSLEELKQACSPTDNYPYGDEYESGACNDEGGSGVAVTGAHFGCVDGTGQIYDLVGNVAEFCGSCLGDGSVGVHGGGAKDTPDFYARCGGTNNLSSVTGGPAGFRCCR